MDRELPADQRRRIRDIVITHPETRGVHDLRTRNAGDRYFLEFEHELDRYLTVDQVHALTRLVDMDVGAAFRSAKVWHYQEPDGVAEHRQERKQTRERTG